MANSFSTVLKSFWHTMTTYDRHSSYDSPQRTGRHVPLRDSRSGMLTGVATASDSRADVSNPYFDESASSTRYQGHGGTSTPNGSYSPGLRSSVVKQANADGFEVQGQGDVQMQAFSDGLPPPPPVQHSWHRIDSWAEENYFELFDQLGEGCTINDLNDLEHQLDCSLPQDVRDSLMVHDGQERGGTPTGIIFSGMLMDAEEIVQEWETWRRVNEQYLLDAANNRAPPRPSSRDNGESSSGRQRPPSSSSNPDAWQENLLQKQDCVPPNSIRKAYAHAGWVPLVRDWGGNNLAVDLAPGPTGRWGQIILFGRDYDTKYVVARSWGAFLALVADDLNSGKWYVDEDTNELKLREFKETRIEPSYFNILRWRMDQKHGRRAASAAAGKRRSMASPKAGSPLGSRSASPYMSPVDGPNGDARGRSMQRPKAFSPLTSPGHRGFGKPPPLSRVTEEMVMPILRDAQIEPSTLVEVDEEPDSPRSSQDIKSPVSVTTTTPLTSRRESNQLNHLGDKENEPPKANGKQPEVVDGAMKTIEI
ncbi:hypothetical protein V2A60_010083 [Cordyceps javanica]